VDAAVAAAVPSVQRAAVDQMTVHDRVEALSMVDELNR